MVDVAKKIGSFFAAPFHAIWMALTKIAALNRRQVRSLCAVALLGGIIAFSAESIGIILFVERAAERAHDMNDVSMAVLSFLTERMRFIAALQALFAIGVIAVVLNADRVSGKAGKDGIEFDLGGSET